MNRFITLGVSAAIAAVCICGCKNDKKAEKSENSSDVAEAPVGSIVYFDLDKVIEGYSFANELRSEVQTKVDAIEKEVSRRQKKLENDFNDFQNRINKGLITSAAAAAKQDELQQKQLDFQRFAQQKQQEVMEEQQVMMNRIADAIKTFIDEYNETMQYSMILANQANMPVIAADSLLDITDDVIAGLNEAHEKENKE